jgi:hypothetical protein
MSPPREEERYETPAAPVNAVASISLSSRCRPASARTHIPIKRDNCSAPKRVPGLVRGSRAWFRPDREWHEYEADVLDLIHQLGH